MISAEEARRLTNEVATKELEKTATVIELWRREITKAAEGGATYALWSNVPKIRTDLPKRAIEAAKKQLTEMGYTVEPVFSDRRTDDVKVSWDRVVNPCAELVEEINRDRVEEISTSCGWKPLAPDEEMTVHYGDKKYTIRRYH